MKEVIKTRANWKVLLSLNTNEDAGQIIKVLRLIAMKGSN